ncbi:MAG: MFS transporter, partial [Methylococcales bacterium]
AWSTAGVLGPVLVNYIREFQIDQGVAKADAYNVTMYIMAGMLAIGFLSNLMIRPVHEKHHMKHDELDELDGAFPRDNGAYSKPILKQQFSEK